MEVPCMWFCLRDVVLIVLLLLTGDIIKTNGPDHMVKATFLRLFIGVGMWINFEFASECKFCWLVAAREKTRECVFFAGHTLNDHFYFPLFELRLICKFSDAEPSPAPMSYPSPKVGLSNVPSISGLHFQMYTVLVSLDRYRAPAEYRMCYMFWKLSPTAFRLQFSQSVFS